MIAVAAVAIGTTGCVKSENEGKLEGTKWASAYVPEFKGVKGATATIRFTEGGQFSMELRVPQGAVRMSGHWRLGPGSAVYLDNVAPALGGQTSFTEYITVGGDTMTMEDPDGAKIVFTRIDEAMEKAAKTPSVSSGAGSNKTHLSDGTVETTERKGKGVKKTYD